MEELPGEMVVAVLGWVDAPDLVAAHLVCRRWHHLLSASSGNLVDRLWRRSYLRTWPPPLSAAPHAVTASAAKPIDWRLLCLQRIGLLRHSDQQVRMAEVAALLHSAATLAAPAPRGAGEPHAGAPANKKKRKKRKESKKEKEKRKKRKHASSSSESSLSSEEERRMKVRKAEKKKRKKKKRRVEEEQEEETSQAIRQSAQHQRHIADVQRPVDKAQQVLEYLQRVAGLRQRAQQLLQSFGGQGTAKADGKVSKERLLTMLFHDGNILYEKIYYKEIDLGDVMHSVKYEASIVAYSLVTGLPLLMTYSFSYSGESFDELSWRSDELQGGCGEMMTAAKKRADYAALQVFLFGPANADTVDPPAMEKFIEGVFVPTHDYYVKCWLQWPRQD